MGEVGLAALLCAFLDGGVEEQRQYFDVNGMKRHVRVDCETDSHVIEIAMDGTSSARDSLHQALFYAHLTGKRPMVVIIDRDGYEGRFEYELRRTTTLADVSFARCSKAFITRWAATTFMRETVGDDLPQGIAASLQCDLRAGLHHANRPSG